MFALKFLLSNVFYSITYIIIYISIWDMKYHEMQSEFEAWKSMRNR